MRLRSFRVQQGINYNLAAIDADWNSRAAMATPHFSCNLARQVLLDEHVFAQALSLDLAAGSALSSSLRRLGNYLSQFFRNRASFNNLCFAAWTDFIQIKLRTVFHLSALCDWQAIKSASAMCASLQATRSLCLARDMASCHSCDKALNGILLGAGRDIRK